jgi:sulfate transport system permease protein
VATLWLSVIVLLPLAAVVVALDRRRPRRVLGRGHEPGRRRLAAPDLLASLGVAAINAVAGRSSPWVLVRDRFRGKAFINALIDLPFALPTIVAGITLLALYGASSPVGINVVATKAAVVLALLFVTLPFVVRSVQPVLLELDREMEEAATSLGARRPRRSAGSSCPTSCRRSSPARRWPSRAPWASSARSS